MQPYLHNKHRLSNFVRRGQASEHWCQECGLTERAIHNQAMGKFGAQSQPGYGDDVAHQQDRVKRRECFFLEQQAVSHLSVS